MQTLSCWHSLDSSQWIFSGKLLTFELLALGKFYNGTWWAKLTFCGVETKSTFIHTWLSAPKMFAMFGCQTQTFSNKKEEKIIRQAWVRQIWDWTRDPMPPSTQAENLATAPLILYIQLSGDSCNLVPKLPCPYINHTRLGFPNSWYFLYIIVLFHFSIFIFHFLFTRYLFLTLHILTLTH